MVLLLGLMQLYSKARHHFSGLEQTRAELVRVQQELGRQRMVAELANFERELLRQEAATVVAKLDLKNQDYPTRQLASVLTVGSHESLSLDSGQLLMKRAKKDFSNGHFVKSAETLERLIQEFPTAPFSAEGYFLASESRFQLKDFEKCISLVEDMVKLFPENELTGYALLRAAAVFRKRERLDDAAEMYRIVLGSFADANLQKQAKTLLKEIEL